MAFSSTPMWTDWANLQSCRPGTSSEWMDPHQGCRCVCEYIFGRVEHDYISEEWIIVCIHYCSDRRLIILYFINEWMKWAHWYSVLVYILIPITVACALPFFNPRMVWLRVTLLWPSVCSMPMSCFSYMACDPSISSSHKHSQVRGY